MDHNIVAYNCKKRLITSILLNVLLICALVASVILAFVYSRFVWVFAMLFVVLSIVLILLRTVKRKLRTAYNFGNLEGVISKVDIDAKNVRTLSVGEVGPRRRFDHYRRDVIILELFIQQRDGDVACIRLEGVGKKHCEYYKEGDEIFRPTGAAFPIVLNREVGETICPACGELNETSRALCPRCKMNFKATKGTMKASR